MNSSIEQKKENYIKKIHQEMRRRGIRPEDVPSVIGKTGFVSALNDFPEEQLHYSISDAVDEILLVAATK